MAIDPLRPPGRNAAGPIGRALDGVARIGVGVTGVLLVALIAIFGWLVWGRYVMNDTPTWVEQAALMIVSWIVFIGAAVGVREHTHLRIEFIRDLFPDPIRITLEYVADLLMTAFGAVMFWQGVGLVQTNLSRQIPMLGMSESWRFLAFCVCGGLIVVFCVARIVDRMRGVGREAPKSTPADGAL
jgi:TRAP-type C4-dicarboxylate transport system permease small subunit